MPRLRLCTYIIHITLRKVGRWGWSLSFVFLEAYASNHSPLAFNSYHYFRKRGKPKNFSPLHWIKTKFFCIFDIIYFGINLGPGWAGYPQFHLNPTKNVVVIAKTVIWPDFWPKFGQICDFSLKFDWFINRTWWPMCLPIFSQFRPYLPKIYIFWTLKS